MSDSPAYRLGFFGLCVEDNHNKVWGWIVSTSGNRYYIFWGKAGAKKLSMAERNVGQINNLVREKQSLGRKNGTYVAVHKDHVEQAYPNFWEQLEEQFCFMRLKAKI
jgi:hypothetical protein